MKKEVMFLFGIGFKDLDLAKYTKGKEYLLLFWMKQLYRLVTSIFGYGFVLNQFTVLCLDYTSQRKETCLLLKNSLDLLYQYMENTVYTDGGTWYDEACNVLRLKHFT